MFNTTLNATEKPFSSIAWNVNNRPIITSSSGGNFTAPEYEGRITLFISTGSLELRNLTLSDSGLYGVSILPHGPAMSGSITLKVLEPVFNVVATANKTDLLEFKDSVRLSCSSSSGSSLSFLWLNGSSEVTASDRFQLTDGNTTLTIVSVTRDDQGPYTCHVSNPVSSASSEPIRLNIYEPVANVVATANDTDLVEFNSSVRLSCSSSGSSLSFLWLNGSSEVTENDRVQLTDGNINLTIVSVTRYDQGPFSCRVSNPVSNVISGPVNLTISCEFLIILHYTLSDADVLTLPLSGAPGLEAWEQITWAGEVTAGFSTMFTCSSSCFPNCVYTWSFLGRTVNGSKLTWTPDGLDNTVELQCNVLNPETGASTTMTSIIEIKNPLSVQISPLNTVPTLNQSLDLVCHDATLPSHQVNQVNQVNQVVWYKDGQKVSLRENMHLLQNTSLHFDSLLPSDAGFYQCETNVATGQQARVFSLGYLLSFDRWNVSIIGPDAVFPGRLSEFTCLTSCTLNVDCTVKWQFRWGFPTGSYLSIHANELRWTPSIPGTFQNFTCVAENAAAGRSAEATKMVEVKGILASGAVEVHPSINPAIVGGTVNLSLSPSVVMKSGSWAVGDSVILNWVGDQQAVFPSHNGRASVNVVTGALTLTSVTVADSGVYVVQSTDPQLKANVSITVQETVSNVTIRVNQTNLMEFNGSAVLTCAVSSGSSLSFLWMNDSAEVTASDRVQLTDGNSTLTLVNVTRYDQGPFTCRAFNLVSNGTSDPVTFTIAYGPDNMALTVNGQNTTSFSPGSNLTMLCSAQSDPPAALQWVVRGELVNTTGPLLELLSVSKDQSGLYSCLAFNKHTNMNSSITTNIVIGAPAYSHSIHASENPLPVGSNVTLFSQTNVTLGVWQFNTDIIVMITPAGNIITDPWKNRVTFNSTTSSLTIRSVQLEDSGLYTLQALNSFSAQLTLSVQDPVSNVTLRANATSLVEYNDTAVLMCSVSNGSSLTYVWLNDSSVVTGGVGVQLSDGGATLTLIGVTRYDEGPFRCNVSNGISHEISLPVHLNISFGPSNASMVIMPMKYIYITGSNITLSCSAESSPPAMVQWMVNGVYLNEFTQQLKLEMVTESNSGSYKCLFHNTVTSRFTSTSAMIRILEPIAAVVVNHTGGPAILHHPFTLRCEVTGAVDYVQWLKNGQLISADNTTTFSMDNKTLNLNPVQHSDNGDYQCRAFNYVSNMTSSPYTVKVNYPVTMASIKIVGAQPILNHTFTLTCETDGGVESISWKYNWSSLYASDTRNFSMDNTTLTFDPVMFSDNGPYQCVASNPLSHVASDIFMLDIFCPIVDVQIVAPMIPAIEGQFYNLTCNVTGPAEHVYWMKNGEQLEVDNTTAFYMDNRTVTFNPLERDSAGSYECTAFNTAWNMTSPPHKLLVNFGPLTPVIDGPAFAETGQTAVFSCSALSMPPSQFSWWFNGSEVANTSVFTTDPLSLNMSGEYACMAYNYLTGRNSTSSKMLTVIEAIESVMIRNSTIPINNKNLTLTCEITGPYEAIYWMKDYDMLYYAGNITLDFTPVTRGDDGTYQCFAFNKAGVHASPTYALLVNYGPLSVNIAGSDSAEAGVHVKLTCSAESRPDCDFNWFHNNQSSPLMAGSVLRFLATKESEGNYTCMATNPVTSITMYATQAFALGE
ncbi:Hemicentin-1 [Nibea albiflora]|uniref:Hemicentin-1 n=1 Tax=Nibea albiflora TaxID=240163 RepID=A0ACB7F6W1_NIBAL|nr:Hemicentin-1 [Nibea albiflora]